MSGSALLVVLFAALLHACWNALVKAGPDKLKAATAVTTGAALLAVPLLPFAGTPAPASWPWLGASVCLQVTYYLLLAQAYRHGDISQAYPLMRGCAPLLVTLASVPLLGERLTFAQYGAVAVIVLGVLALTGVRRAPARATPARATRYALANAVVIAAYTLIDGIGVRASGAPAAYTLWLFVLTGAGMLACSAWRDGGGIACRFGYLIADLRRQWPVTVFGGAGTMTSYGLALWAMTQAPVAVVAALRETSILFATLIAALFLRERVDRRRLAAVTLIGCGAVAMRLAR